MLQPSGLDGLGFDLLSHFQDLRTAAVIDSGRRQISQALVLPWLTARPEGDANYPMSQNAACRIGFDDLEEIAALMMGLPAADAAAA